MVRNSIYIFLLMWGFIQIALCEDENSDPQNNKVDNVQLTMAPNSKFLNPHVDDATNLQLAIAAFNDEHEGTNKSKNRIAEVLTKLSESLAATTPGEQIKKERMTKLLRDWRLVSFLHSLITGNNNKFKI